MGGALWQWKEPIAGHKYIMGIDVSRGDSEDFTTFCIIDFDEREQVLEYLGKIPPDVAAEIALNGLLCILHLLLLILLVVWGYLRQESFRKWIIKTYMLKV